MKRSLGAELAVGSTETPSSVITRLEAKVLNTLPDKEEGSLLIYLGFLVLMVHFADILLKSREAALLENTEALKQFLRRCTRKRFPDVKTLKEIKTNKKLHYTHRGAIAKAGTEYFEERFRLHSNKLISSLLMSYWNYVSGKHMAIFATDEQLCQWAQSKKIVCDASFKYRPQGTYQIYRIFGFVKVTHCTPLATILMRNKDRGSYDKMWRRRKSL